MRLWQKRKRSNGKLEGNIHKILSFQLTLESSGFAGVQDAGVQDKCCLGSLPIEAISHSSMDSLIGWNIPEIINQ